MSASEKKVAEMTGKFIHPLIMGGSRNKDAEWTPGRLILSNKNIWLISNDGKQKIGLDSLKSVGGDFNINQEILRTAEYITLKYDSERGKSVSLITSSDDDRVNDFRKSLHNVILNGRIIYIKHPVMKGGVMQDGVEWRRAQIALSDDSVRFATENGELIKVYLEKVQDLDEDERSFEGEKREVLSVEHSDEEDVTVASYIYGPSLARSTLKQFIGKDFDEEVDTEIELNEKEKQVITALYSGVSPFEIPNFIGAEIDEVEEIYERLIEMDVLNEIRKRREVNLTTRGRNLASKSIGEDNS